MIKIDLDNATVTSDNGGGKATHPLQSPEAFAIISKAWLRCGWDTKHVYSFTWLGRPMIQLPEDMFRAQEVLYRLKPDVIIETGVAHGGSLVFYAGLCHAMGKGKVIGVDVEIHPHNRAAIEAHELFPYISLIEGDSVTPGVVARVKEEVAGAEAVFALLDSNHSKTHVLAELEAYAPLVSVGSYIVAADGIMGQLAGAPRTSPDWAWNNPEQAAREFVERHPNFVIEPPAFLFNEGMITEMVTYWSGGWIKRVA